MVTNPKIVVPPKKHILLERILVMGITGSGKSYQWLKLASDLRESGAQFYVIDTDNDITYMLYTQFPECTPENGGNVHVYPAYDWPQYKTAFEAIRKANPRPQDWIVVDKINHAWSTVQRYFIKEVFKDNMGEYFLMVRKKMEEAKKKGDKTDASISTEAMDSWIDWPVINNMYADWIAPLVYQTQCNVYCTTDVEEISKKEKNAEIKEMFGNYGVKPAGQKNLGGQFHTIFLYLPGRGKWYIKTVKDRAGRVYFEDAALYSFYMQYLVAKANWGT
jgi:hypothetical protein